MADMVFKNYMDSNGVSIENSGTTREAVTTTSWTEEKETIRIDSTDAADTIQIGFQNRNKADDANSGAAACTFIDWLQVLCIHGDPTGAVLGINDLVYNSFMNPSTVRKLEAKTFS
jgi:hypothetical protein